MTANALYIQYVYVTIKPLRQRPVLVVLGTRHSSHALCMDRSANLNSGLAPSHHGIGMKHSLELLSPFPFYVEVIQPKLEGSSYVF